MTDRSDGAEDDRAPLPDLTSDEDAAVRRLLADAGGAVPTPPDVVARLDATLSRLVAERDEERPQEATVTPLAVRRRRWPKVLLAAAAVVVGGYGVGAAVTGSMSGSESDSGGSGAGVADSQAEAGGSSTSGGADDVTREPSRGTLDASGTLPRLTADQFDAGVARLLGPTPTADAPQDQADRGAGKSELSALRKARGRCAAPPSQRRDTWYVVRYDGKPATLVVDPTRDGVVRARVFSCDGTTLLRDSTVDLP